VVCNSVGSEATTWLLTELQFSSRDEAVDFGQYMLRSGLFHHVQSADYPFRDNNSLYRFDEDDMSGDDTAAPVCSTYKFQSMQSRTTPINACFD
jgi:hypothetical protein